MIDGGILFRGKIELPGSRKGKGHHGHVFKDVYDGFGLVEADHDDFHFITRKECVIMHFHELIHHQLGTHGSRYSNEMVHEAYVEWKAAQDKAAAKKAMQAKVTSGLTDMFKNKLNVAGGLKLNTQQSDLDSSKLNLLTN